MNHRVIAEATRITFASLAAMCVCITALAAVVLLHIPTWIGMVFIYAMATSMVSFTVSALIAFQPVEVKT